MRMDEESLSQIMVQQEGGKTLLNQKQLVNHISRRKKFDSNLIFYDSFLMDVGICIYALGFWYLVGKWKSILVNWGFDNGGGVAC